MVRLSLAALTIALTSTTAFAQTEISWWHAMDAELGQKLEAIAQGFNESQDEFVVVPTYKGTYAE
ncbi:MAG TPA: sn-glycerol-3-phosphate ABC transporter substrate-binding protein, partial [Devosia sp.]|nr:sn-glycerol-3-phosphate ABC transporter substrate-binding protein [Devosia sp.]